MIAFFTGLWARWIAPFLLPIVVGIAAAALLGFVVQTTRIEGLKILFFKIVGFKEEVSTLKLDLDNIKNAQTLAKQMAEAARAEDERKFRDIAERAEREHQVELAEARSATDRFILRNRVRKEAPRGPSGAASASGQGADTALPSDTADPAVMVIVHERDVKNHGDTYIYAKKAYDLFQDMIAKGQAVPAGTTDSPAH